jgi:hypothetical protein
VATAGAAGGNAGYSSGGRTSSGTAMSGVDSSPPSRLTGVAAATAAFSPATEAARTFFSSPRCSTLRPSLAASQSTRTDTPVSKSNPRRVRAPSLVSAKTPPRIGTTGRLETPRATVLSAVDRSRWVAVKRAVASAGACVCVMSSSFPGR